MTDNAQTSVTDELINAGAQALVDDVWHPPQKLSSLSPSDQNKFRRQSRTVIEAIRSVGLRGALAQAVDEHASMLSEGVRVKDRPPHQIVIEDDADLSEPPFAFRFEYADKSAFEVMEDGRAFVVSADGSKRHEPRGKITSNIRRLIGRALLLRSRAALTAAPDTEGKGK